MDKTMTPPKTMTDKQVNKGGDVFRAVLQKHQREFPSEPAQKALGAKGLATELLAVYRKYVEMFTDMIVRCVSVNRALTPQQVLDATGRKKYVNTEVVASMPKGEGEKAELVFFKPDSSAYDENGLISDDDLEKQFESHGLKPCDPYSLAAYNAENPAFADEHPNSTHWKDSEGKWCYAAFSRWGGAERVVRVHRGDGGWNVRWWFAGLRK